MTLRNRDVKVSMRRTAPDDPGEKPRYRISLTYKPTGVEVSGDGEDLDELRASLQRDLEELVGLEGSEGNQKPDNILEFPKDKWKDDDPQEAS